MDLRSAFVSSVHEARNGGIALSSVLLAAPLLLVAHPRAGVLFLAAAFVGAVAFVQARAQARARDGSRGREVTPRAAVPLPLPVHSARCRASWELVERDGHRSLVMRWR